jgi:transposase InsO family protein
MGTVVSTRLLKQGWILAKKTVLKLMNTLGLACKVRRRKRYNSYQGEQGTAAPNLLNREFEATAESEVGHGRDRIQCRRPEALLLTSHGPL